MKSLTKNYYLSLAYQLLLVVLPLITAPYLARVLEADRIGAYSFAHSIVSYFVLFAVMGTALYGQRTVARVNVQGGSKKQIFLELLLLRILGTAVALAAYFLLIYRQTEDKLLYMVAALEICAVALDISWFYQGIEQFGRITLCSGIAKVACAVGIFTLVY